MSLYRRKDSPCWWINVIAADGRRIQQSTGTSRKIDARAIHDRVKSQIWEQKQLGVQPRRTWKEAVLEWISVKAQKKTLAIDKGHFRWLDPYLGEKYLDEIDRELLKEVTAARSLPYEIPRKKGPSRKIVPSVATVNRTLEVLRGVLRAARDDWGWIASCPRVSMLSEPAKRVGWITRKQAGKLLGFLPKHQRAMVRFALETGLRRSNVTKLEWSQVDLDRALAWIHPDQAKAQKAIGVPLSEGALIVLRQQDGKHDDWVFPYRGKPVTQTSTKAWRSAVKLAGLKPGFRWHDLRHTWASWHAQDGTPLNVLQELGGWSSTEMVQRYAHLATKHLSAWVDGHVGLGSAGLRDDFPTLKEKATARVA